MSDDTMARGGRAPSISWVVLVGAGLVVASALTLLAAPVGYRLGIVPLRTALLTLFRWGAYGAVTAVGVSLVGLVMMLRRPRGRQARDRPLGGCCARGRGPRRRASPLPLRAASAADP